VPVSHRRHRGELTTAIAAAIHKRRYHSDQIDLLDFSVETGDHE